MNMSACLFLLMFFALPAWCQSSSTDDVSNMLLSLQQSLPELFRLATGSAYVMGICFGIKGIYDLKQYGEGRTMMSGSTSIKGPLTLLFVAAMCVYTPTAFQMVMMTTFGYSSVLAYQDLQTTSGQSLSQSAIIVLQVIQVIGAFAMVRGFVLLANSSEQGGHGAFAKGITHVVGGVFAINIVGTCNVIANTFGITL